MAGELETSERELFSRLIEASGKLATQADQASVVLDEQFEDMCRPFIDEVRHILSQCPAVKDGDNWDGELHDADLEVRNYYTSGGPDGAKSMDPVGVEIIHLPTGIGRKSESKRRQEENHEVAKKALLEAVTKEYERRGKG